jgi:hypothetical protein
MEPELRADLEVVVEQVSIVVAEAETLPLVVETSVEANLWEDPMQSVLTKQLSLSALLLFNLIRNSLDLVCRLLCFSDICLHCFKHYLFQAFVFV